MGKIEQEARTKQRNRNIQRALLASVVVGGLVLIGGVPSPTQLFHIFGNKNKYRSKYQVKTVLSRLTQKGLICFVQKGNQTLARITETGRKQLAIQEQQVYMQLQSRKRWNKRWRVIIFDIPEKRRGVRDRLRYTMQKAGFFRLQDSVWLYPYDCEDFIALLKADLKLGNAVLYMVVEQIENDSKLKEYFKLT